MPDRKIPVSQHKLLLVVAHGHCLESSLPRNWGVPASVRGTMRFVLATVPDPAHTHLGLFFDRQIEAIEQAAQKDGYNFARAYMPWDSRDHPESSDLKIRLLHEEYMRNREKVPA